LKSPEETVEQKQQRPNRYKDLLIVSAPFKDESDDSSSVLCLITLPEDDQSMDTTMPPTKEQLTVRIDADGKIIKLDTTMLRPHFVNFLAKEIGHKIEELVHPNDHQRLRLHLKEVIQGQSDAQITNYRIQLAPDCFVHTRVESRMFRNGVQGEPDFVMAVHEILPENEAMALDGGSFSGMMTAGMSSGLGMSSHQLPQKHSQGALGGPLMTSVINGGPLSTISPRNCQNSLMTESNSSLHPPTSNDNYFSADTFDFDFPSTTFEIENSWAIESRPESRTSIASVSTPRPSSATAAFSPVSAPMIPSPLTPYHTSQPSPASITNNNNNTSMTNNNLTNSGAASGSNHNGSSGFSSAGSTSSSNFQFFDDKEKVQEQLQRMQQENSSERLRNLLMKSPSGSGMEQSDQERARNQILKVSRRRPPTSTSRRLKPFLYLLSVDFIER
jgi:PAS domain